MTEFAREHTLALGSSLDSVLAEPGVDAVIVATPHSLHEPQVLAAVASGKQVFCEKPLALTAAGAERILEACAKAGVVLGIGHERRFEPAMERLLGAITQGELGRVLHLDANVSHNLFAHLDASSWRVNPQEAPAGAMTALGIHLSDLFISFAGRPKQVQAKTAKVAESGAAAADYVSVQIDFLSGATGSITCLSATPYHGRLTVFGTRGWVEVKENGNVDKGLPSDVVTADAVGRRTTSSYAATNTVLANFDSWAKAVAGGGTYRFTPEQILDNVRILEAVTISSANGSRPVRL
jgi:predicted dehydrogenase